MTDTYENKQLLLCLYKGKSPMLCMNYSWSGQVLQLHAQKTKQNKNAGLQDKNMPLVAFMCTKDRNGAKQCMEPVQTAACID